MRKLLATIITIVSTTLTASAFNSNNDNPIFRTESFRSNIRSVQIYNYIREPLYPVFELGSDESVLLKFDDLAPEINSYAYKIVHCNANWQADDLSESQYINGFTGDLIDNFERSINTFVPYTHYELEFPNENASPTISGNYVIFVYDTEDPNTAILTARFMVTESVVSLTCTKSPNTDIDVEKTHQQVNLSISYPQFNISQPSTDLKVVIQQNNRTDNEVVIDSPTYYELNKVSYRLNKNLIFDAGNEFRTFDISSLYVLDHDVKSMNYYKPFYHATLYNSEIRAKKQYEPWLTVSGRYIVNAHGKSDPDLEADYVFVHFTLPMEAPFIDGKIYILGEATGYKYTPENRMDYNYETRAYQATLLLKQGGYNYLYAYLPDGSQTGFTRPIEGDFWQTNNEYATFVYYHPFGGLYDQLIGFNVVK